MVGQANNKIKNYVQALMNFLVNWRVVMLSLKPILLWEKLWYPAAVIGFVTMIFFLICLADLNTLTMVALIGFALNFANLFLPSLNMLIQPTWTEQQEAMYEEICYDVILKYYKTAKFFKYFNTMRAENPLMYYPIVLGVFCSVMWITSTVSNLFLLYLITIIMVLWPGVSHTRIYNTCVSIFRNVFNFHVEKTN